MGSIADELRKWGYGFCGDTYEVVNAIADRIDAEHEKAVTAAHSNGVTEYGSMVAREYIKLPVDADGVPIRIGDEMECDGEVFKVKSMRFNGEFWAMNFDGWNPAAARHHREPTVEDVLTEFGINWEYESDCEDRAALLKEYAAKLRKLCKELLDLCYDAYNQEWGWDDDWALAYERAKKLGVDDV